MLLCTISASSRGLEIHTNCYRHVPLIPLTHTTSFAR
jgi:hypothetical protein